MTSKWKEKQQRKLPHSLLSESLWAVWFLSASLVRFYHIYLRQLGPAGPAFFLSMLKAAPLCAVVFMFVWRLLLLLLLIFSVLCCVTFSLLTPFHRLHFSLESPTDSEIPHRLCKVACSLPSSFISSLVLCVSVCSSVLWLTCVDQRTPCLLLTVPGVEISLQLDSKHL